MTVRHLLSHLSGIKEYLDIREFSTRREYSDADLLKLAIGYPLNFAPGEQFDYTNTGYCVLAMVIERTTKKLYGDILRERIFAPLGMRSTRVNDSTAIIPRRAAGYAFRLGRRLHADFVARTQLAFGDCGVISTVNDLILRFLPDQLSVMVLFNGELEPWKNNDFARDVADLVVGRKSGQRLAPGFEAGSRRAGRIRH